MKDFLNKIILISSYRIVSIYFLSIYLYLSNFGYFYLLSISQNKNIKEEKLEFVGFRPQPRIDECVGCKSICEECELLMIFEKKKKW